MSMSMLHLQFVKDVSAELEKIGFEKRRGEIYTKPIAEDFLGWIGLNQASSRSKGAFEINPVVGVRSQEIEKQVAAFLGEKPHPYLPATISQSLGYLTPQASYRGWFFAIESDLLTVTHLRDDICRYALPFMESSASIEQISQLLETFKYGSREHVMCRLSVAYLMLGKRESALAVLNNYIAKSEGRSDPAALLYRRFARAVIESLD